MIIESIIGGLLIMTPIDMGDDYNEHLQDVGQAKCLADNMYFEARNQGTAGIIAVSNVVLNRVKVRCIQIQSVRLLDKALIEKVGERMECITLSDIDVSLVGIVTVNQTNLKI